VDCVVGTWAKWSDCSKTCGNGSRTRTRTLTQPRHGGRTCPVASEVGVCNTHSCMHVCSHTQCSYIFAGGAWRTNIMTHSCSKYEMHGKNFHCQHHFGTNTVQLGSGLTATHTDECVCYCSNVGDADKLTHHYDHAWRTNGSTDITQVATPAHSITLSLGKLPEQC